MFHFWFNTFFVRQEEHNDAMNGSSSTSQSNSTTPSTFYTSHYQHDQHKPIVSSLSSSLPASFPSSQQSPNTVSQTASSNSYADNRSCSHPKWSSTHVQYNQQQNQSSRIHKPSQSSAVAASTQQYDNRLLPSQANVRNSTNNSSATTTQVNRQLHPPAHRKQTCRTLTLEKMKLDKANKDKQHKLFHENFEVSCIFV